MRAGLRPRYAPGGMDLVFAICQAIGIALAIGIGGPLAALFVAAMASLEAGFNPTGTDWAFVGAEWFLVVMLVANVATFLERRRGLQLRGPHLVFAAATGAVFGAASLAEQGEPALLGLVLGAIFGAGASLLAGDVLAGALRRAGASEDAAAPGTLTLAFGLAGVVVAAAAIFVSPVALLALVALVALAAGRRRRAGEKYQGLRVLR